jgi:hypothetical protein
LFQTKQLDARRHLEPAIVRKDGGAAGGDGCRNVDGVRKPKLELGLQLSCLDQNRAFDRHHREPRRGRQHRFIGLGDVVPTHLERFGQGLGKRELTRDGAHSALLKQREKRLDRCPVLRHRLDRIDEDVGVEVDLSALEFF